MAIAASRQRLGLIAAALVAAIVVAVAAVAGSGSGSTGPAAATATVVPADALAYVHVSTQGSRPEVKQTLALARRFPDAGKLSTSVLGRLTAIVGGGSPSVDFTRDIRPWLGDEAALALLNTASATAGSLIVLDVSDRARAQAFLTRSGASAAGRYRGADLLRYSSGTELAFAGSRFLVLGQDASVRAALDVAAGGAPSLAEDPAYRRAVTGEPGDRVLDAYASTAGVRRVLSLQGGLLGAFGALVDRPALQGVAVALSPAASAAKLWVHTVLDRSLLRVSGGPAGIAFAPTLLRHIPAGAALMLDAGGFVKLAPRVLAAGAAGGVAGLLTPLLHRLGTALAAEGVNVAQILSIFQGETAIAIVPGSGLTGPPAVVVIARERRPSAARAALAALEVPLAQLFSAPSAASGAVPEFNDREVAGVTAHQLALAPGLQLDYAVFDGLAVVSTSLDGIAAVAGTAHPVTGQRGFQATLGGRPRKTTSLLFLDFSQLLNLGEQTGLTRSSRFLALRSDLDLIRAIGLSSTSGEADTTAELLLQIS